MGHDAPPDRALRRRQERGQARGGVNGEENNVEGMRTILGECLLGS